MMLIPLVSNCIKPEGAFPFRNALSLLSLAKVEIFSRKTENLL